MNLDMMIEILIMKYKDKIEKELGCVFIRINPDVQNFNELKAINRIQRHIKKSYKKIFNRKSFKNTIRIKI